ncbi:hypothetical protein WDZ92_25185 [Nostoc sp. NIES-2111]
MKITRTVAKHGSLLPRALDVIRRVPHDAWTHLDHGVLHPRVAYGRALSKVATAWQAAIPALSKLSSELRFNVPRPDSAEVEEKYGALLHALYGHIEACYAVMRCVAPVPAKPGAFHQSAVRAQKLPGAKMFEDQVLAYKNASLGPTVNLMKHSEAKLRILAFRSRFTFTLAYFVDGPQRGGVIGPALNVHADGNSAFSFNRDMLVHWWWLFRSSELLSEVIEQNMASKMLPAADGAGAGVGPAEAAEEWVDLCRAIAAIPPDFTPDECEKPYPLVVVPPSGASMRLEFPAPRRPNKFDPDSKITGVFTIDEGGQSYRVPYLGDDENVITVEAH